MRRNDRLFYSPGCARDGKKALTLGVFTKCSGQKVAGLYHPMLFIEESEAAAVGR
jgi:hypothetical protein